MRQRAIPGERGKVLDVDLRDGGIGSWRTLIIVADRSGNTFERCSISFFQSKRLVFERSKKVDARAASPPLQKS